MIYDQVQFDVGEEKYIKIKVNLGTDEVIANPTFTLTNNKYEIIESGNCDVDDEDNSVLYTLIEINSIGTFFLTFTYVIDECIYKKRIQINAS